MIVQLSHYCIVYDHRELIASDHKIWCSESDPEPCHVDGPLLFSGRDPSLHMKSFVLKYCIIADLIQRVRNSFHSEEFRLPATASANNCCTIREA